MPFEQSSFNPEFAGPSDWAELYRSAGLQAVPAKMPDFDHPERAWKMPALKEWVQFQEEVIPEAAFRRFYGPDGQFRAHRNVGLLTGRASDNVFVLDLDTHKNEAATLWWQAQLAINNYGAEPETWKQRTGGGGRQLLFKAPQGWLAPTNRTSQGVDIRGQGGFAMLPPSLHMSRQEYRWEDGCAPWEVEIASAPQWLLDAIDELVDQNGGHRPERDGEPSERTLSPSSDFDAFANRIDGREDAMRAHVWAAIMDFRRQGGTPGTPGEAQAFEAALHNYLRKTKTRLSGVDNIEGLERECRGPMAFLQKWQRAMKKWGTPRFEEEAAKPSPFEAGVTRNDTPADISPSGTNGHLIQTAAQFVAGFTPPNYLVGGMIQRGYLYSLTARTGHGKTAVSMYLAQAIARGQHVRDRKVRQGAVLILAGENPDDIRARFLVLAEAFHFDPAEVPIHFLPGIVDLGLSLHRIRDEAGRIGDLGLVVVDTAAAYYKGDDANSNAQMGEYARLLRQLTFLPGKPAVIVNSHPTKNANQDNLVPYGGSAFVNEVDGNLTLWSDGDDQTMLHWQWKFRGAEFEPISFALEKRYAEKVVDDEGTQMPSVVAQPVSEFQVEATEAEREGAENRLLAVVGMNGKASVADLARKAGFVTENGQPQKSSVFNLLQSLEMDKLVERHRRGWKLTPKGRKELGWEEVEK